METQSAKEILKKLPPVSNYTGDSNQGEIQLSKKSEAELRYDDQYIAVVRDPVIFPGGKEGNYLRIIEKSSLQGGVAGVVIIPRLGDKFVILRNFRHPTRSWEIEFPRGFSEPGDSPIENARREALEELGVEPSNLKFLGVIKPNTGLLASVVHVYSGTLPHLPKKISEDGEKEAISDYLEVSKQDLFQMIAKGEISDGFTLGALTLLAATEGE